MGRQLPLDLTAVPGRHVIRAILTQISSGKSFRRRQEAPAEAMT